MKKETAKSFEVSAEDFERFYDRAIWVFFLTAPEREEEENPESFEEFFADFVRSEKNSSKIEWDPNEIPF